MTVRGNRDLPPLPLRERAGVRGRATLKATSPALPTIGKRSATPHPALCATFSRKGRRKTGTTRQSIPASQTSLILHPVPPEPRGLREASRGRAGERCPWRKSFASSDEPGSAKVRPTFAIGAGSFHHGGVFVDGRSPPSPAGRNQTARAPKENRARGSGSGQWRCLDISTSTFGTQPSTATPPWPRASLGIALAFKPSRRQPAGGAGMDTHDLYLHAVRDDVLVIPGERSSTRDPCLSLSDKGSGMDPGSTLRFGRDDLNLEKLSPWRADG
jgi:hypothetical protein